MSESHGRPAGAAAEERGKTDHRIEEEYRQITAADLMSPEVLTVRKEMTVPKLALFLAEHEISGAPVRSDEGELVGVVSVVDVARTAAGDDSVRLTVPDYYGRLMTPETDEAEEGEAPAEAGHRALRVADIMTPAVFSVSEETPVERIAELMLHAHLHRVPVLRGDKLVGIVSTSDLLGLLVGE